jgi:hypothetical protein
MKCHKLTEIEGSGHIGKVKEVLVSHYSIKEDGKLHMTKLNRLETLYLGSQVKWKRRAYCVQYA